MCLIKGAFVGEKNFDVIKMHGTTIKIIDALKFIPTSNGVWQMGSRWYTSHHHGVAIDIYL